VLTDNEELAYRCRLARNHGEVILDDTGDMERVALGSNYRMTELHAAIGIEQLKKLDGFLKRRRDLAARLSAGLRKFPGLAPVYVPENFSHAYYVYPFNYDKTAWGLSRRTFAEAVRAEGLPLAEGYVKPIYLMNIYQHKKVYNNTAYPFAFIPSPTQEYKKGLCPVTEKLQDEILLTADICRVPFSEENIDEFLRAVGRIWENKDALAAYEKTRGA
jgi:dTDP-4-amino-4,6-dideoxygalactose transaminase